MDKDVAELVERLEDKWKHSEEDCFAAASTIRALVAERDAAEAKLREAVEVMKDIATSDTIDNCLDPQRNKRVALAFLATMEKQP